MTLFFRTVHIPSLTKTVISPKLIRTTDRLRVPGLQLRDQIRRSQHHPLRHHIRLHHPTTKRTIMAPLVLLDQLIRTWFFFSDDERVSTTQFDVRRQYVFLILRVQKIRLN